MTSMDTYDSNLPTEDTGKWFDLNPDRDLLDSNFEGYKLSLDAFPQYKLDLTPHHQLDTYSLLDENESNNQKILLYQHLKLIGLQNLVIVNQYDDSNLYYFDSQFRLVKIIYRKDSQRSVVATDLQLDDLPDSKSNRVNVTMKFISPTAAVIFDGYETIYFVESGEVTTDSLSTEKWTKRFKFSTRHLEKFGVVCILKDALLVEDKLHLLFMNVQEKVDDSHSAFDTLVNWLQFERDASADANVWSMRRLRRLNCFSSVPDYVALETNGQSVYVAGPDYIRFEFDSVKAVKLPPTKKAEKPVTESDTQQTQPPVEKFYTWNQTSTEINLNVRILDSQKLELSDLAIKLSSNGLELIHQGKTVISDSLFSGIKLDESTWTLNADTQTIEFLLTKANTEIWPCCLKDMEHFGEYRRDEEVMETDEQQQEKAKGMFSWEETKNLYRLEQQLEECDEIEDEPYKVSENGEKMMMFRRMDGETHLATHKACINDNKFLFDVRLGVNKCPGICLRHDVDGLLWQPNSIADTPAADSQWLTHVHTFDAFGYVQASKTNTKFRACAPDCSYACLADTNKHVYVYRSVAAETQLKNRKSGKLVSHVAKQYLISLEDNDEEIYGLYCARDYLVVLLSQRCFVYKINAE